MTQHGGLVAAAVQGGVDAFESIWMEMLDAPPPAAEFLAGLEALPEVHRRSVAPALLQLLLESYQAKDAHADVLAVMRELLPYRPRGFDALDVVKRALTARYGDEPWFERFVALAGIEDVDVLEGLEAFDRLLALLPGSPVYHATGWGEGVVVSVDLDEDHITVSFRSEVRERSMPFQTGLDVLRPLERRDLRARLLIDVDGLQHDAENDPSVLIRAVARLHKGRATSKEIKQWLEGAVIPSSGWASWWKKAKVAAAHDPYLAVENPARPLFILRKRALSPAEEVGQALDRAKNLTGMLDVVRGPLSLDPADDVKAVMLDHLRSRLETPGEKPVARVEASLLLARHGVIPVEEAGRLVGSLVSGETRSESIGDLLSELKAAGMRKEALDAFIAAEPTLWSDAVIGELASVPPALLDTVTDRLLQDGRGEALANRFGIFLMSPSRQPAVVTKLAKHYAAGMLDGVENAPSVSDVVMGLLHLAETQAPKAARDDRPAKDALKGVSDVLFAKKKGLMAAFGKHATRSELERAMHVLFRCRSMPDDIGNGLKTVCHKRFPDLVPRDETPFWETNAIFCTRKGIARRQEEHRVLLQEKIPENSEQIGRAAAYGDLSENYEWTAAIEQQRQLTEKAAAMEAELRLARAIEDQELKPGVVSPGTRVTYERDGEKHTVTILGPWDVGEGLVSYRAPIAAGMLGAKAGETATLELPDGAVKVMVTEVVPVVEGQPA
ncbi:MAG: GreA/GreB family elongation factor [Planctomycetes bacterium]|nr:GreA/GreB family elongation factor [Planctomycetota bacterium]